MKEEISAKMTPKTEVESDLRVKFYVEKGNIMLFSHSVRQNLALITRTTENLRY